MPFGESRTADSVPSRTRVFDQITPALPCLYVWVVGNPTSGGKRGAVVIGRLAKLFQETYGVEAVRETYSSRFLSLVFPASTSPPSTSPTTAATASAVAAAAGFGDDKNLSRGVFSQLPTLDAVWASGARYAADTGSTPPITPPSSPQRLSPPPSSSSPTSAKLPSLSTSSFGVRVQTMFIYTDQGGHAKLVSNVLSRFILHSRLTDQQSMKAEDAHQHNTQHTTESKHAATAATANPIAASISPRLQHLVLAVGGDGTLSEVVNGLCEGTLAAYKDFTSALDGSTSSARSSWLPERCAGQRSAEHSSHAHVEQEAVVFTRLLPAVLYVPGGTGADFAKLGLCCATPEAALHVVRDGVVKMLFCSSGSQTMGNNDNSPSTNVATGVRSQPVCYACPTDIGRIEFLRTGTRHFFINIASIGMSCDVIQRGERFKRSKLVSKLGGTLLFALSALISLLLLTPKPLYLCKLPPRTIRGTAAMTGEEQGRAHDEKHKAYACGNVNSKSSSDIKPGKQPETQTLRQTNPLLCVPSFAPLVEQLKCLQAELPQHTVPAATFAVDRLNGLARSHPFSSLHGDSVYVPSKDEVAYGCHADTPMPPPHAKVVRCTTKTPTRDVRDLLDINENELQALRSQQALQLQQMASASPEPSSEEAGSADCKAIDYTIRTVYNGVIRVNPINLQTKHREAAAQKEINNKSEANENEDDLSALTWVELPSSMVAFANGRWYGGGMHVAPHANPTDGMLSCTNWVATVLPFVSGVLSLYTGRHLRWCSTSAFEGQRFLVCNAPPSSADLAKEPLYMEADGEVLEPVPAIVELVGKITFIVPRDSHLCLGDAAPGTTRARLDAAVTRVAMEQGLFNNSEKDNRIPATSFFANQAAQADTFGAQVRRLVASVNTLWRRTWSCTQRWVGRNGQRHSDGVRNGDDNDGNSAKGTFGKTAGTIRRARDSIADEIV